MPLVCEARYDEGIEDQGCAAAVGQLLDRWRRASADADGAVPDAADFAPTELPTFADYLMVLEPHGFGDFRYIHYGPGLIRDIGVDMTGRTVSDLPGSLADMFKERYRQTLHDALPRYTVHRSVTPSRIYSWERLILPLTTGDGGQRILVFNLPREFNDAFIASIFESGPNAIVVLRIVRDAKGAPRDAVILNANGRALDLFQPAAPAGVVGRRLRQAVPGLASPDMWEAYTSVLETGRTAEFEQDFDLGETSRTFRISLARFGDGVTITLTDIDALKQANAALEEQQHRLIEANQNLTTQAAELAQFAADNDRARRALAEEIERRKELEIRLRHIAETDPLTGLANRRLFVTTGDRELGRARRYERALSIIMLDIDHFKAVNDTFGHMVGDDVLIHVANSLRRELRQCDLTARLGGEEFVVLVPETSLVGAMATAERLRQAVERLVVATEQGPVMVTATFGVAEIRPDDHDIATLISRADEALYRGKSQGRNRVMPEVPVHDIKRVV